MTALDTLRPAAPGQPGPRATTSPAGQPPIRGGGEHSWRWLRLVTPVALLLLISAFSAIVYTIEQPDVSDLAYLSPQGQAGIGASRLAGILASRGVHVERETHSSDALVSAYRGDATLVLPTPTLMHPYYLRMLKLLPASTRVVVIAPSEPRTKPKACNAGLERARGEFCVIFDAEDRPDPEQLGPVEIVEDRLAAKVVDPGCVLPPGVSASAAAVGRSRFTDSFVGGGTTLYRCYGGSLVGFRKGAAEITVVGAADPFRNDRIDEHEVGKGQPGVLVLVGRGQPDHQPRRPAGGPGPGAPGPPRRRRRRPRRAS